MSQSEPTLEAAEIVERILRAMPRERTATAAEREAYLRGAVNAWRIAAGLGKG